MLLTSLEICNGVTIIPRFEIFIFLIFLDFCVNFPVKYWHWFIRIASIEIFDSFPYFFVWFFFHKKSSSCSNNGFKKVSVFLYKFIKLQSEAYFQYSKIARPEWVKMQLSTIAALIDFIAALAQCIPSHNFCNRS